MERMRGPLLLVILLAAHSTVFSQRQPDSTAVQQIRSVLTRQAEAWNEGDLKGYMLGYWRSDSLLFTSGGKNQRGWQATLEKYTKTYDSKLKMGVLKFSQLEITLLSPESAWVLGHWELERKHDRPGGVFTLILRKFSDGWKIIHDHTSKE